MEASIPSFPKKLLDKFEFFCRQIARLVKKHVRRARLPLVMKQAGEPQPLEFLLIRPLLLTDLKRVKEKTL